MASSDAVRVAVRVRPASLDERRGSFRPIIKVVDEQMLVFDPCEITEDGHCVNESNSLTVRRRAFGVRRAKNLRYAYDHVFGDSTGQALIFERTTRPLIDYVIKGYKASVFAYGATGSGKTHTMLGSTASGPGVMVLAIEALFDAMRNVEAEHSFALRLSYLEVYNETIRDLLGAPETPRTAAGLTLRQEARKGVTVCGLSEHEPTDAAEVLSMLERGNAMRAVSETAANAQSSRSHAVLQIRLTRSNRGAGVNDELQLGQLSLIDLAGSERACVSRNRGATLAEGANINRSLLALGNCINALSSGKTASHVPYRDSKLTRLLKDALGGTTKTVMIATVSPAPSCTEDTHNTLKYAHRAKEIKVAAQSRSISVEYHVTKYKSIIAKLQAEVAHWKDRAATAPPSATLDDPPNALGPNAADSQPPSQPPLPPPQPRQQQQQQQPSSEPSTDSSGRPPASPRTPGRRAREGAEGAELYGRIDALYSRRASAQQQLLELERTQAAMPPPPAGAHGAGGGGDAGEAAGGAAEGEGAPGGGGERWAREPQEDARRTAERVRAALGATLAEADSEEGAIRARLDAMPMAERRAVLMQV